MGDFDNSDLSKVLKEQPCTVKCRSPDTSPVLEAPASRQVLPEFVKCLLVQGSERVAPSLQERAQVGGRVNVTAGRSQSIASLVQSPGKTDELRPDTAGTNKLQGRRSIKEVLQHSVLPFWGGCDHPTPGRTLRLWRPEGTTRNYGSASHPID
jgi:hypothetical protein